MAKRYRYAFAKQKESKKGVLSISLAVTSVLLFLTAVILSFLFYEYVFCTPLVGGISIFAMSISVYGFIQGLRSFGEPNCSHRFSTSGTIANGVIMIGWLGLFLLGL